MENEENKNVGQSQSGQDPATVVTPEGQGETPPVVPTVDYEAEYKRLQAEHDRLSQEHQQLAGEYEAVKPYISFEEVAPTEGAPTPTPEEGAGTEGEEAPVTRKEFMQFQRRLQFEKLSNKYLDKNPDLKAHQDLVCAKLITTDPRKPLVLRLIDAGNKAREELNAVRNKAAAEAEAKAEAQRKAAAAAGGFGAEGATPSPKPKEVKVETAEEYIAKRKAAHYAKHII